MKKENLEKARDLVYKLDRIYLEIDELKVLNANDSYTVSWCDLYGCSHRVDISAKIMLPVIKKHRENLIEEKFKLEKKLEEL